MSSLRRHEKHRRAIYRSSDEDCSAKEVLNEICYEGNQILKKMKKCVEKPTSLDYDFIFKETIRTAKEKNSKCDYRLRYGDRYGQSLKLPTDEELVSLAIYKSLMGIESLVVTRDSDLARISFDMMTTLRNNSHSFISENLVNFGRTPFKVLFLREVIDRNYEFDSSKFF